MARVMVKVRVRERVWVPVRVIRIRVVVRVVVMVTIRTQLKQIYFKQITIDDWRLIHITVRARLNQRSASLSVLYQYPCRFALQTYRFARLCNLEPFLSNDQIGVPAGKDNA